ncbi:hypothetical protein R5R35_006498 [Gryllus longicercus]|uniref:Protein phosphatase methylesterase 1 n=1 Tax=Gryllus longicercus TaxID=2509291 RepID=A0AAN9VEI4_9ORTH
MSSLQKSVLKSKLPPIVPSAPLQGRGARRGLAGRRRDYTPVQWDAYFTENEDIRVNNNKFRVYKLGTTGPVLMLLHGGGFSALTWSLFSASVTGMVECRVVAMDLRGHGDTVTEEEEDLSAETMAKDVGDVVAGLYGSDPPSIVLIGHSMGGAIAVHTAIKDYIPSLIGLAVIDVVEGTALDALASMQSFLRSRPSFFKSLEHAIEWCVRSGQVRNTDSARVSMPGQIKNMETGALATNELNSHVPSSPTAEVTPVPLSDSIQEEEGDVPNSNPNQVSSEFKAPLPQFGGDSRKYTWRIDLGRTEKHWAGWFKGLSNMFLSCPVPKMLLLAGIDRLDKDLTVGQMQGKFQMQVLPQCGHAVHEDVPDKVAEVVATFLVRHKFAEPAANFERTFPAC